MKNENHNIDYCLDITDDVCPMTFVKTRLHIEKMTAGELLVIRLKGAEPLQNVPDSVRELGHSVLSEAEERSGSGIWRIVVRKN
jgi:tRNA 2-thiouridine synthesizing protein A